MYLGQFTQHTAIHLLRVGLTSKAISVTAAFGYKPKCLNDYVRYIRNLIASTCVYRFRWVRASDAASGGVDVRAGDTPCTERVHRRAARRRRRRLRRLLRDRRGGDTCQEVSGQSEARRTVVPHRLQPRAAQPLPTLTLNSSLHRAIHRNKHRIAVTSFCACTTAFLKIKIRVLSQNTQQLAKHTVSEFRTNRVN